MAFNHEVKIISTLVRNVDAAWEMKKKKGSQEILIIPQIFYFSTDKRWAVKSLREHCNPNDFKLPTSRNDNKDFQFVFKKTPCFEEAHKPDTQMA